MGKVENSMRQYMFKTALTEMVQDFVRDQPEMTSEEKTDCAEYLGNIIRDVVPSSEWNIHVHMDDDKNFDEFIKEQMQCVLGLLGLIISFYVDNLRLTKKLREA